MKTSVCITVFNEEKSIRRLLESLLNQTKKPDQIIIVDGGSTDKTVEIIRHLQKKDKRIKLLVQKCSRAKGRNYSVEIARNEIIAMTDAGCRVDKNWLKRITDPFKHKEVGVVAGFYKMKGKTSLQKAASVFLGVVPSKFDIFFLPSTRSIAFRKSVWERTGGFPENLRDTAEDTVFNYKLIKEGIKFTRVKNAIVEWGMPSDFNEIIKKMYAYAKGDAKSKIWWHPSKKFASHNIRVLLIFLRYLIGVVLVISSFSNPLLWYLILALLISYSFWSFRKVYLETQMLAAGMWGIVLQYASDIAIMGGFIKGII